MKKWQRITAVVALVLGLVVPATGGASAGGKAYEILDLGGFGGVQSIAVDINNAGVVAGHSMTAASEWRPFIWKNGVMTDLGGGPFSQAVAINEVGEVIGNHSTANGKAAFIWSHGKMTELGTLGGASSTAVALNDRGQVVGYSTTALGGTHAFIWDNGIMTDLGVLGVGDDSRAAAINNAGEIAGISNNRLFIWKKGEMTDLGDVPQNFPFMGRWEEAVSINKRGVLSAVGGCGYGYHHTFLLVKDSWVDIFDPQNAYGYFTNWAVRINNKGQVAGNYSCAGGTKGFFWDDGKTSYFDLLNNDNFSRVTDMNNKGRVIGYSHYSPGSQPHGFIWNKGTISLLPTLFGESSHPRAINNSGEIVGSNGGHAVLWTPLD